MAESIRFKIDMNKEWRHGSIVHPLHITSTSYKHGVSWLARHGRHKTWIKTYILVVDTFTFQVLVISYVIAFSKGSFGATVSDKVVIKSVLRQFFRGNTRVMWIRNIMRGYVFVVGTVSKVTHGVLTRLWLNIVCEEAEMLRIPLKGNDRSLKIPCTRSLISPTRRYR